MKKLFIIFSILTLGLISCSSCKKDVLPAPGAPTAVPTCSGTSCPIPSASPDAGPVAPPTETKVADGEWEMTIPAGWEPTNPHDPDITAFFTNPARQSLILFIKEPFKGTAEDYAVVVLRILHGEKANVVSLSAEKVDGLVRTTFVADKDGLRLWTFATARNDSGYILNCGGKVSDTDLESVCLKVGKSFHLK
jgi:hypothetical protein